MICIISGSVRNNSCSYAISQIVLKLIQQKTSAVSMVNLKDLPNSAFSKESFETVDSNTKYYLDLVVEAQALYLIVPEYNGSYPGVLKHFLDLLEYPKAWQNKKIALVGLAAGYWGGIRPIEHLQGVFSYRDCQIFPQRVFIPQIYQNLKNKQLTDEFTQRLTQQAHEFVNFVHSTSMDSNSLN